jgi:hypothetical protein
MLGRFVLGLIAMGVSGALLSTARAGDPPVSHWAVTGVAADDVLHLRDVPSADSQSLARIPPTARGLKNLGCRRPETPFGDWARMSDQERNLSRTRWCRVVFDGREGWVAFHFLKPDPSH